MKTSKLLLLLSVFFVSGVFAQNQNERLANQARAMIGQNDANSKKLNTLKSWDAVKYVAKQANLMSKLEYNSLSSQKIINVADAAVTKITSIPKGYIIGFYDGKRLVHCMISTGNGKAVGVNNSIGIGIGSNRKWEEITLQQLKLVNGTFKRGVKTISVVQKPGSEMRDINYFRKGNSKVANSRKSSSSQSSSISTNTKKRSSSKSRSTNGYGEGPPKKTDKVVNRRPSNNGYGNTSAKTNRRASSSGYGTTEKNGTGKYPVPPPPSKSNGDDNYAKPPPPLTSDNDDDNDNNLNKRPDSNGYGSSRKKNKRPSSSGYGSASDRKNKKPSTKGYGSVKDNKSGKYPVPPPPKKSQKTDTNGYGEGPPSKSNGDDNYSKPPPPLTSDDANGDDSDLNKRPTSNGYGSSLKKNKRPSNDGYGSASDKKNKKPSTKGYGSVKDNKNGKYPVPPPPKKSQKTDINGYGEGPPSKSNGDDNYSKPPPPLTSDNDNNRHLNERSSSNGYGTVNNQNKRASDNNYGTINESEDLSINYSLLGQYKVTDWGINSKLPPARIASLAFRDAKANFERGINLPKYIAVAYNFLLNPPLDVLEKNVDDDTVIRYHKASNLLMVFDSRTMKPLKLYKPDNGIKEFKRL